MWLSALILSFLASFDLIAASCLKVTLTDLFGDGWDDSIWYYEGPSGTKYDAPSCGEKSDVTEVCGGLSGSYYLMVSNENGEIPENYWEVTS